MFKDQLNISMQGFIKIFDRDTGEILADTHNDVLFGNASVAFAHTLIGNPNSFLSYMAFGNGGAYVSGPGPILYKPTLGGPTSTIKNPTANLYNTIYVKKISNNSTTAADYSPDSRAFIPFENYSTTFEDIIVDVTINHYEPPVALSGLDPNAITFNEIGLFIGSNNLFNGDYTQTQSDVDNFITQSPNFSTIPGIKSKLMITHVIFSPITKSAIRSLEIEYTLRVQLGVQ
jgi:hypothetical protein